MVKDCARLQRKMRELKSTLTTVETIFARNQFPGAGMNTNLLLSVLTISAILLVATLATVEDFPSVENATMSSFVTMTKKMLVKIASANLGWATPNVVGLWDPMCYAVLSSNVTEIEVHLCLERIWEHLLMVCKLGDLDTWRTSQSTRSSPDKLGTFRRSAICSVSKCGCSFCVNNLSTIGCVRAFSLVTESSLLCDSTESSKLQMWLWFGPTYVDWVEARRLRLRDRFRIVAFPQHLAQNLAQVSLCEFHHLLCCLWHPLSPSCRAQVFLVQVTSSQIDRCCCDCKLFLSATFGTSRGIDTLSNNIRDYICHLGDAVPRIDSFLWKSEPKMSVLDYLEMEFRFSSPRVPNTSTMWTSMTGPTMVSPEIAAKKTISIVGLLERSVQSRHSGMGSPKPSSSSGLV